MIINKLKKLTMKKNKKKNSDLIAHYSQHVKSATWSSYWVTLQKKNRIKL